MVGVFMLNTKHHFIYSATIKQCDLNRSFFVYDSSVRSGESVIATVRLFCARSNKGRYGAVQS